MKLDITTSEPRKLSADSRAQPCPQAEDDDSAAKYLYELSRDVILFLDRTGKILCINPCGIQLSGYSAEELRGANIFGLLLLPEDHSAVRQMLQDAVNGEARECEVRWRTSDGAIVHFAGASVPRISASGEFLSTLCTLRDVTEGKRAEEALRESEERYRVLVEFSPNSICVHRDGKLLYVNPAGVRLFGATDLAELVGRSVLDFIHPDSLPVVRERLRRLRAGGTAPLIEERFVTLNGDVRDVEVTAIPITYENGPAAQVIIRDITERKQAEERLRASEQVARGQVEALTYSLDVLATAPAPDKFLGQMLSTIGRLLKAQSVILWLLDEANDSLVLRAAAQGTNFAAADPAHPFIRNPLLWKKDKVLQETVFTGAPVICEDVEDDPRVSSAIREYFKSKGTKKYLTIPTLVGGRVKGFIGIRHEARPRYRPEEIELAQALAHQAMLAIQLNEFAEQSRQAAILEERNRMARDIHDTLAQGFTGVIVQLEAVEDAIACCRRKEANEHLQRASELARQSLNEARRSVHALRPQALQRGNFWEALKGIVKNTTAGTTLHTRFELRGKLRELPLVWQENLLHIGQEALTNALKYARPRNFKTRLICNTKELRLELRDDGDGFKINSQHDGFGLAGMRERVEQMGGELKVTSSRSKGTKIIVTLPYNHESVL
jgi:PAS domain S-box-containing protein